SSSTIRISDAIDSLFTYPSGCALSAAILVVRNFIRHTVSRKNEPHPCAAFPALIGRRILENELAAVVFHHLVDDGEAKPCAFRACCHVRLGQARAIRFRQTAT